MSDTQSTKRAGRPGVPEDKILSVMEMIRQGVTPREIISVSGLSQTKVYEIIRRFRNVEGAA